MESVLLFVLVLGLLLAGVPIAVSLGLSSILYILLFSADSMSSIALKLFEATTHYTLLAIPFFILASNFMATGGVARRIVRFAVASVGQFPGGLAMAGVFACMLFAALSGSSPATVVAVGSIVIAGMVQAGYTKEFAAGVICNAGTLGILIPPSIVMVVYAAATDVSVGRMFLGGVIPGLIAGLMLMLGIYVVARVRGLPSQPFQGWRELLAAFRDAGWGLFLVVIILGGIYGGIFTPTEAAAVSAVYAFLVANFIYRDMGPLADTSAPETSVATAEATPAAATAPEISTATPANFAATLATSAANLVANLAATPARRPKPTPMRFLLAVPLSFVHPDNRRVLVDSSRTIVMLMFIIANALLFAHVLTSERIPQLVTETMVGVGLEWWSFLLIVNLLLLLGGQFMEPSGLLLIVAPVVFPLALELGIDPIHLGIMMVVNMEIGLITPPIGLNLFVTAGITQMSLVRVIRAAMPWLLILLAFLVLITYVPQISTWLPTTLMGPEIITR